MSLPDKSYLYECFSYCETSGALTWKRRPRSHFSSERSCNAWNARFPGQRADQSDGRGYFQVKVSGVKHLSHRVVFAMAHGWAPDFIDHIDGERQNNTLENLRPATKQQNARNANKKSTNTSGYKGVSKKGGKWRASICIAGKMHEIGQFDDEIEAANAYDNRAAELFGGFAKTNSAAGKVAA